MRKGWNIGPADVECTDKNSHSIAFDPYGWPPVGQPHDVYNIPTSASEQRCVLHYLLLTVLRLLWCLALRLPGCTVLLNEGLVNRRSDELAGGDGHSIELTEVCT